MRVCEIWQHQINDNLKKDQLQPIPLKMPMYSAPLTPDSLILGHVACDSSIRYVKHKTL